MHFIYRIACAAFAYCKTVAVFFIIGVLAASIAGIPDPLFLITVFAIIFFGPMASYTAWQDVGD
jgi:hypothetical protein